MGTGSSLPSHPASAPPSCPPPPTPPPPPHTRPRTSARPPAPLMAADLILRVTVTLLTRAPGWGTPASLTPAIHTAAPTTTATVRTETWCPHTRTISRYSLTVRLSDCQTVRLSDCLTV